MHSPIKVMAEKQTVHASGEASNIGKPPLELPPITSEGEHVKRISSVL